jgi:putative hydroxymethylpyrimidine transport system substrate-binding protein
VVGAYWVHESILIRQQMGSDPVILRMEEWGVPDFYELVLVTSEKTIKERPERVQAFLRAVLRGYAEAATDMDGAIDTLVEANPEVDPVLEREGIRLLLPLWSAGVPAFGWQTAERWRSFAAWMVANADLDADVDPDLAFTNRFVEELSAPE